MQKNSFSKKEWIDLVFEDRNKSYGAYQLRSQSGNIMLKALFIGIMIVVSLISIPVIAGHFDNPVIVTENNDEKTDDEQLKIISIDDLFKKEDKKVIEKTESPKNKKEIKSAEDQKKFVTTTITDEDTTDEDLASKDDYEDVNTGAIDIKGDDDGVIGTDSPSDRDKDGEDDGVIKTDDTDGTSSVLKGYEVDKMPEFPGGMNNFMKAVRNNFRLPDIDRPQSITVYVSFVVEVDGSLSDIQVLRDPGYGLAKEAIRTLQRIKTKWEPGIKNGKPVRTSYTLPIKVEVR